MRVTLCDVGPRDGLQNEAVVLEPAVRAELARRLAAAGVPRVEVASFVDPRRVPQMARAEEVVAALDGEAEWSGLVLNERGWERLAATGLARANLTLAATETFNRRNGNRSLEQALAGAEAILAAADRPVTATVSVAFGCPFEGAVDPARVADLAGRLAAAGADELVLADTIGVATPGPVRRLTERVLVLGRPVGGHSTTRGTRASRTPSPPSRPERRSSMRRSEGWEAARSRRARPATSPPRTSSTRSRERASRPASTSTR